MQLNSKLEYVVGNENILLNIDKQKVMPIFSDEVVDFLSRLSQYLLKNKDAQKYPDVVTLAFWCRRASVKHMGEKYKNIGFYLGRGVVFHIAPSNVAVNFAYSFVASLLAGNANLVRLPSKDFPQVEIICSAINKTLKEMPFMEKYIVMVRYSHDKALNDMFSDICKVRVIWGGDRTIRELRKSPLQARATEITFADRHSIAIIGSDAYLEADTKAEIANDFYNDTYLTDQNACTSPRVIIWVGNHIEKAQTEFWKQLHQIVKEKYVLRPVQAVDKLTRAYIFGAYKNVKMVNSLDNIIMRIKVHKIDAELMKYKGNSGFFIEYEANMLEDILPLCDMQCQTVSYYGISTIILEQFVCEKCPQGIDRIVPLGKTMDFFLTWDGYDLIRSMSREITII